MSTRSRNIKDVAHTTSHLPPPVLVPLPSPPTTDTSTTHHCHHRSTTTATIPSIFFLLFLNGFVKFGKRVSPKSKMGMKSRAPSSIHHRRSTISPPPPPLLWKPNFHRTHRVYASAFPSSDQFLSLHMDPNLIRI
jgi:hypothetical protein